MGNKIGKLFSLLIEQYMDALNSNPHGLSTFQSIEDDTVAIGFLCAIK